MARLSDRKGALRRRVTARQFGRFVPLVLCAIGVLSLSFDVSGAEFRRRIPVRTPDQLPNGAVPVTAFKPVDRALVEQGLKKIFAAYSNNPAKLAPLLADKFHNKSRLLDTIGFNVPSGVKLNLMGIDAVSTVSQYVMPGTGGAPDMLVSMVNATARSQFIYNDPVQGYRQLDGTADYLLRVRQRIRKR